jgi:hypothetical protein
MNPIDRPDLGRWRGRGAPLTVEDAEQQDAAEDDNA